MFWLANPENAVDSLSAGQSATNDLTPAPRMNKVIAARQAVIYRDFDEDKMLEHIVNTLASDVMAT